MQRKRKCNVTSVEYLDFSHVLEILLIKEVSLDIVGLQAASIKLLEFLMQLFLWLCLR